MGMADKDSREALAYFKKLNDTLFLAMRYVDRHGVIVIPTDSNMPVFSENPSHFCVNGTILDVALFPQYKSMCILRLLEEHPQLVDAYPRILPENREIVKIAKTLQLKSREHLHENCRELRGRLCPDIGKYLGRPVIETNGNKQVEDKVDVQVLLLYHRDEAFSGITKAFSDQYLSVYRKIKALLDKTAAKENLVGKCLITYAVENGKFVASLFLDADGSDAAYYEAVGKLKEYVVKRQMTVGFPMQVRDNQDMAVQAERIRNISRIFEGYCVYILN